MLFLKMMPRSWNLPSLGQKWRRAPPLCPVYVRAVCWMNKGVGCYGYADESPIAPLMILVM